jgi:hypothetical protein
MTKINKSNDADNVHNTHDLNFAQSDYVSTKKNFTSLKRSSKISRKGLFLVAIVFAAVGYYVWHNSFAATPALLSQGKPTAASSTSSLTGPASYVVDGSTTTRWSSNYSDPQWLQVDLQSLYSISEVKLNWEAAYGKAYQIQLSTDGSVWSSIYTTSTGDGGIDDLTGFTGVARYVRMYGTVRGTQWGYSLWEFQVYGTPFDSGPVSFLPQADTYVSKNAPNSSYGSGTTVYIDGGNSVFGDNINNGYLKFDLSPLAGKTISSAKLRLFVTNPSSQAQSIKSVADGGWDESITWNTKPAVGSQIASLAASTVSNNWVELDLTNYIKGLAGSAAGIEFDNPTGIDGYVFDSREGANPPQLALTLALSDITPPTVSLLTPTNNSTVSGTAVNISASSADSVGVSKVEFYIDSSLANIDTVSPYSYAWDSIKVANGTHTIAAKAYDVAGNSSTSNVTVNVSNAASVSKIYWGAWMDGKYTYNYHYPGQRPAGWFDQTTEWGPTPWDSETYNKFESNAGKKQTVMQFGIGSSLISGYNFSQWKAPLEQVRQRGEIADVEAFTGNVALRNIKPGGTYEPHLKQWFKDAAAYGHPFYLALDPEMNGGWQPYSTLSGGSANSNNNTPAAFVTMWKYMHDLANQAGASNITWVWAPNVDPSNAFVPYSQLYPGDGYVDWTGLRGWNKYPGGDSADYLFGSSYAKLLQLAPNKPISLNTVGTTENGNINKVNWLNDFFTNLPNKYPKIKNFIWFNWRFDGSKNGSFTDKNDCLCEIESSSTALQAWKSGLSSSYYMPASSSLANLPLRTKVPIP